MLYNNREEATFINQWPGREIREPRITQQDYLHLSTLSYNLRKNIKKSLAEKRELLILDIGCGVKPYYPFFAHKSPMYIGVDILRNRMADIISDAHSLPFRYSLFDAVICTQVLEHVKSPEQTIDAIHNILKPDGFLFLSTHGIWPIHNSYDFWRWTDMGLKELLSKFSKVEVYECGGPVATITQLINLFIPLYRSLRPIAYLFFNKLGETLDKVKTIRARSPNLIINYLVVARK